MPVYPYACTACGHAFEVQQSFSDPSLTECPECSGRLRKVFSSVGVVFKGSGFYRTDSRAGGGKSGSSKSDGGSTSGASKGTGDSTSGGSGSSSTPAAPSTTTSSTSAPAAAAGS